MRLIFFYLELAPKPIRGFWSSLLLPLFIVYGISFTGVLHAERPGTGSGRKVIHNGSGATVILPKNYQISPPKLLSHSEKEYTIRLFSRNFSQGDVVYTELLPPSGTNPTDFDIALFFDGKQIPLTNRSFGKRGIFGIPRFAQTGNTNINVGYKVKGRYHVRRYKINVKKRMFPISRTVLKLGSYSNRQTYNEPDVIKKIKYSRKRKDDAFSHSGSDMFADTVSHPRNLHYVTSEYYTKRVKEQYRIKNGKKVHLKPLVRYHRGLDLRGKKGDPVYAIARGRVTLAENLFFEGNFVLIDHGNEIQSAYMHLDSLKVKVGDIVNAGQPIATVGSSGAVTGPHLHISLYINRSSMDPMSLLNLPIRD